MTTDLQTLSDASRVLRQRFDDLTTPHREALWRYCRKLTGSPWDAEDLVQETLLKAFARLSFTWQPTETRGYLFRIASNAWIDRWRRERPAAPLDDAGPLPAPAAEVDSLETRDALKQVVERLSPRQRVVFLLTEAFGFTHGDVAGMVGLTTGAVKALRFRARERLAMPRNGSPSTPLVDDGPGDLSVLGRYVDAFNRRDVAALVALFDAGIVNEIVGVADEIGADVMAGNSLAEWLADPLPTRALLDEACGRLVIVVLQQDAGGDEAVAWVVDPSVSDGRVIGQRLYCFCPELLEEVGAALQRPVRTRGYRHVSAS